MKIEILTFIILTIAFLTNVYADHTPAISVTVDGVTYHCSGSGGDNCFDKVTSLRTQLTSCDNSAELYWCIKKLWPIWKQENPTCLSEGRTACIEICDKSNEMNWCIENCK